jgi:hypothetical protein
MIKRTLFYTLWILLVSASISACYLRSAQTSTIAFLSERDGHTEIYTMNPDGTHLTQLTHDSMGKMSPVWNPAGDEIEFTAWPEGSVFDEDANIARYLGAWSERVKAIAVIGVPFGPAVNEEFDRFIDEFIAKWGGLAKAYRTGVLSAAKRKSAVKGRLPVWVACSQAMRNWPRIDPEAVRCPVLLLAGTRNKGVIKWIQANRQALLDAKVQIEIVEGLNHPEEFTQAEQVYPIVNSFLISHYARMVAAQRSRAT